LTLIHLLDQYIKAEAPGNTNLNTNK